MSRIWISWEKHRRSRELAKAFDCELHEIISEKTGLARYTTNSLKTLSLIRDTKPNVVFVQSPSSVAAFFVALLKNIYDFTYLIDAHNSVPNQFKRGSLPLRFINSYAVKKADFVIVTNQKVEQEVTRMGANCLILADKQPDISATRQEVLYDAPRPYVTIIASYQSDEPVETILEALSSNEQVGTVFVTGKKPSNRPELDRFSSERIKFTGYLAEDDYETLIASSDLLVDSTTDDAILVCGGYEAIEVEVPAVVSNSSVSRSIFSSGFLYADATVESFKSELDRFFKDPDKFKADIIAFHKEYPKLWKDSFEAVNRKIQELE